MDGVPPGFFNDWKDTPPYPSSVLVLLSGKYHSRDLTPHRDFCCYGSCINSRDLTAYFFCHD